jgi:hypothetical protein
MLQSMSDDHLLQSFFRCWTIGEVAARLAEVRLAEYSRLDLLTLSFSHFDPKPTYLANAENCRNPTAGQRLKRPSFVMERLHVFFDPNGGGYKNSGFRPARIAFWFTGPS